mmetsp:Transcript_20223/g.59123  ORF Transcript_20223/g.59123 Transcript_20223/m.59123 type:complete len:231 (+) Transcript_20223:1383-2075(+)
MPKSEKRRPCAGRTLASFRRHFSDGWLTTSRCGPARWPRKSMPCKSKRFLHLCSGWRCSGWNRSGLPSLRRPGRRLRGARRSTLGRPALSKRGRLSLKTDAGTPLRQRATTGSQLSQRRAVKAAQAWRHPRDSKTTTGAGKVPIQDLLGDLQQQWRQGLERPPRPLCPRALPRVGTTRRAVVRAERGDISPGPVPKSGDRRPLVPPGQKAVAFRHPWSSGQQTARGDGKT